MLDVFYDLVKNRERERERKEQKTVEMAKSQKAATSTGGGRRNLHCEIQMG